jgi:hypothetical protein
MITVSILFSTIVISIIINEGGSASSEQNSAQLLLLYDLLETALTDNPSNLLNLQRVYYHPARKNARDIRLSATVAFVVNEPLDKTFPNVYGKCPMLGTCTDRGESQSNQYCETTLALYLV